MNINKIELTRLYIRMLTLKVLTLEYHLSSKEAKKYTGCEFDVVGDEMIPQTLHTWVGKDNNYRGKYHKEFVVPQGIRIPLYVKLDD